MKLLSERVDYGVLEAASTTGTVGMEDPFYGYRRSTLETKPTWHYGTTIVVVIDQAFLKASTLETYSSQTFGHSSSAIVVANIHATSI